MRSLHAGGAIVLGLVLGHGVVAQESQAAKTTRQNLKQKITVDFKDERTYDVFQIIQNEPDKPLRIRIDNASGISNNTKVTYKAKDKTVEQILNELSDKLDCGWVVISNASNNKVDGWIVIRKNTKGKERGYELGKEPKQKTSLLFPAADPPRETPHVEARRGGRRVEARL